MRIGAGLAGYNTRTVSEGAARRGGRLPKAASDAAEPAAESLTTVMGSLMWEKTKEDDDKSSQKQMVSLGDGEAVEGQDDRSEAVKVYEEAFKGGPNPLENLRVASSKVPYGHLAKDGVIVYNGVLFTCDEKTNSICLGDVSDPKKVINVTLSGGGHLKVNRDCIDQLGKAIDMFSPEDVNLIMRAIHQDTKLKSMQKEIEDLEASVGGLTSGGAEGQGSRTDSEEGVEADGGTEPESGLDKEKE